MRGEQVVALLGLLERRGVRAWIAGGWGVDALVGRQSRPHADLDLAVDAAHLDEAMSGLVGDGFVVTTDWLPVRVELTATDGRVVDVHPVVFSSDGSGLQAGLDGATFSYPADGFTTGRVEGRAVGCLTADQQRRFHAGYELREVDRHDLALLDRLD